MIDEKLELLVYRFGSICICYAHGTKTATERDAAREAIFEYLRDLQQIELNIQHTVGS